MIKSRIYYVSVYFQYVLPIHFILLKHSDSKHILLNISKSKGNRTMKFGQSIEYNMKSIFLEKSYANYGGETKKIIFGKNQN